MQSPWPRGVVSFLIVLGLLSGAALAWLIDYFAPGELPSFSLGCALALLPLWIAGLLTLLHRQRWQIVSVAVTTAAVLLLWWNPWDGRHAFVRDLHSVQTGMTVDEVEAIMGGYMKGMGAKWHPGAKSYEPPDYPDGEERASADGTMIYRWSDDGAYDSDFGCVTFTSGRVVKVEFMPD